ncbi:hypothetical protein DV096_00660 [Bradymonadaceae bacterium TMQ3]|uniref:Uncharacterized protein n=1 Tax=Lujinxingia sediminis TaxID=2480984 RepID=A0ABY0CYQ2_9DELT|nr:hypothetical protein [Lujinxingia sediminis]RDV39116.1 hypothetical protein DV096_00660 [Bradymonadaceae bacterium TMQ3]RVU48839.1 hypothetical protein EA187_05265 [Lujinxingia sediminis]TXC78132.1 hypothetical protein FRC91_05230 [Bradymonadales bacterium TMQ1]
MRAVGQKMLWVAVLAAVTLVAQLGFANSPERSRQQIGEFRAQLEELESSDRKEVASRDVEMIEGWLQEAEVLLANGQQEAVTMRMRRVEYGLDMVRALVQAGNIDASAESQEERYHQARAEIEELQSEISALERRKAELQEELNRVSQQ